VPLRDTAALDEWAERENPSYSTWKSVGQWVQSLIATPWQAPSVPFPELSDPPNFEVRDAELHSDDQVAVFYRRQFKDEIVDLIWVGRIPQSSPPKPPSLGSNRRSLSARI
jgi:hypothetical protein